MTTQDIGTSDRNRLAGNLESLRSEIHKACDAAGRPADSVTLVAVTKSVGLPVVRALLELGQQDLGESRPERLNTLVPGLHGSGLAPRWHLIGHLQKRKIRDALPHLSLVHSVHEVSLAETLDRRLAAAGRPPLDILLQVNVTGEESKQGLATEEVPNFLERVAACGHLNLQGLMTMAPAGLSTEKLRQVFAALRKLRERVATAERPFSALSMGMSGDFREAILEGATLIRVGTRLFEGIDPHREV